MKYEIRITIEVDPEARWLEIGDTDNCDTLEELFTDLIYDLDDIKLKDIDIEQT